ncbi:carbamoyltransferase C-terminal domain-containing protein [Ralstonia pseudosolanacearum]|uniref:carbamoyltransferase C-terminal domain-containing protein n=1 Tax=Ralstonia pseudosolanacearum TaxID=1310165 RepID=UPI0006BD9152|nr:carbamoyltransferase C-terminal domain-containing protein [Ralstonia pseudosolanacearum]AKZ29236.1 proline dehydrogenase [Ralstonia solanacearum]MBX9430727.1 proline dehydrogenase [Ralstonia pseudosolanacearum]BCM14615.1 nodulation protein U [Ralstonia solanacearum]
MKIFAMKPGHDGAVALVDADAGKLVWSLEAEKDSFPRFEAFNPAQMVDAAERLDVMPDVFAVSGWGKGSMAANAPIGAGYYGWDGSAVQQRAARMFGHDVKYFSSSHERSHLWCSYGLSPFEQGQPCYVLVWEGALGDFYRIDEKLNVISLGRVMMTPGNKYSFLYALADPTFTLPKGKLRNEDPGKLMALCAYGASGEMDDDERELTEFLLKRDSILATLSKEDMRWSKYYNIGLDHPAFTRLAKRYSDEIFNRFYLYAKQHLTQGYPLLISGGCGLNCDWNTMWRNSGLFRDVFVPPCTNDTGSAIGTAIDAMREFTGKAKVEWNVYADRPFVDDTPHMPDVDVYPLDLQRVASFLSEQKVVAWTQGRCEIGPRALGNRSILAAPFTDAMRDRLNHIKKREGFRPVAPICLEEDVSRHFDWQGPSPHMLYFQHVNNRDLRAVTHIDGTARTQTVNREQNPNMHGLLNAFKELTGAGVLCNTSLNFNGTGFINRTSDLYQYCKSTGIEGFVYDDKFCVVRGA